MAVIALVVFAAWEFAEIAEQKGWQEKKIKAITVWVQAFDIGNHSLGDGILKQYLDLYVRRGELPWEILPF